MSKDTEYISKSKFDAIPKDYKTTVGDTIKYSREDKEMLRKKYKDLGYDETDPMILTGDSKAGTVLKPVKVKKEGKVTTASSREEDVMKENKSKKVEFKAVDVPIEQFDKEFETEYGFLYDNRDNVAGYTEALDEFDYLIKNDENFKAFVKEFVKYHGDYISSDREAVAFMFALEKYILDENKEIKTEDAANEALTESIQSIGDLVGKIDKAMDDIKAKDGKVDFNVYELTSEIEEEIERTTDSDEKDILTTKLHDLNNLWSQYDKKEENKEVKTESMIDTTPEKFTAHCDECLEDFEYTFDPLNEVSNDIEIYQKGKDYAYYAECSNCGNLVEVGPEELDLVVTNVDDISKDGFFMEIMDKHTARKTWLDVSVGNQGWQYEFNQTKFDFDNDKDIVISMFIQELEDYDDVIWKLIDEVIADEHIEDLEECATQAGAVNGGRVSLYGEKAKQLREKKANKVSQMSDIDIVIGLEEDELTLQDKEDWERVKTLAKSLAGSQGFYGRLLADMEAMEDDIDDESFPIIL